MLLAALGKKASLALKRADDQSTSLHEVTTNHKTSFLQKFSPKGMPEHSQASPAKQNKRASVFFSAAGKETAQVERDSSSVAPRSPGSSSRLACAAPGSPGGAACLGAVRRKHPFRTGERTADKH